MRGHAEVPISSSRCERSLNTAENSSPLLICYGSKHLIEAARERESDRQREGENNLTTTY